MVAVRNERAAPFYWASEPGEAAIRAGATLKTLGFRDVSGLKLPIRD